MFAPPVAKPKAKSTSNDISPLHRAAPFGQRHGDVEQAPMFGTLPQGGASLNAHGTLEQDGGPAGMSAKRGPPRPLWNYCSVPAYFPGREKPFQMPPHVSAPRLNIQAKLKVGAVDDPLEHEADRVADQVIRMPGPGLSTAAAPQVSRKCAACEEDEKLQKKPTAPQAAAGEAPAIVHEVLRSPGQPLDAATRAYFEPRFARDFSQERIHTDGPLDASAQAVHTRETTRAQAIEAARGSGAPLPLEARRYAALRFGHSFDHVRIHTDERASMAAAPLHAAAFTLGSDIVFGANRYAPVSQQGQLLLQHELRHVEQQRAAAPVSAPELDSPYSTHEQEARRILNPHVEPLSVQRIQCAPEDAEFSLGGGLTDSVGKSVFGDTSWPFIKAVFEGFVGGLQTDVKSGRADAAKSHLSKLLVPWNAVKFYAGYLVGLVIGLVSPITDLVKGIIGVVKLSVSALEWLAKWSPVGVAVSPERQQKIARLMQKFADLSIEFGKALDDFVSDPKGTITKFAGFLDKLMQLALGKARELGAKAAHSIFDFLEKEFYDMGESIGEVIGALIAQILLLVFSDAIGNLISKGASFLGKAAEFVAGKAVEVFEWVKGLVSEVVSLLRNAVKGALKMFEGLTNKVIEAFDALAALFTESAEALDALGAGGEKVAAGVGRGVTGPKPNVLESRIVSPTRTAPAKVSDLTPPKVHPSNVGKEVPKRGPPQPEQSVHVQLEDNTIREYQPSEVKGDLRRGAEVSTAEGKGKVVSRGEPPHAADVEHPPGQPLTPEEKPRRITNPKHHPKSKSPEPINVDQLFENSVVDKNGVRWAKDADGTIHRFSKPSNGETHWNGSTGGVDPIQLRDIPVEIRRELGI